jgi:hypothetical protein
LLFPGRLPAQSITTTPPLVTAPSSHPHFSSTTTSELHVRPTCASPRRQLQSCTFVLPALLLDDNFQALLVDLPSSTSAGPVTERTLVIACFHTKVRRKSSTEKYVAGGISLS